RVLEDQRRVPGHVRAAGGRAQRAELGAAEPDLAGDLELTRVEQAEDGADRDGLAGPGLADDRQAVAGVHRVAHIADQVGPFAAGADLDVQVFHPDERAGAVSGGTSAGRVSLGHARVSCLRWMASAIRLRDTTVMMSAMHGMITSRGAL